MPVRLGCGNLPSEAVDGLRVDAELALPHQRFARQLQQDAVETRAGHAAQNSPGCDEGGPAFMAEPPCCQLPCSTWVLLNNRFRVRRSGSRSDFGREVFLLLLDAFAELEANEAD